MRIDLRYILPIAAFYAPAAMFAVLYWLIGIPFTPDNKAFLAFLGGIFGVLGAIVSMIVFFDSNRTGPIWLNLRRKGDEE